MSALGPMMSRREVVPVVQAAVEEALARRHPLCILLRAELGAGRSHLMREVVSTLEARSRQVEAAPASISRPYSVMTSLLGLPPPATVPARYDEVLLEQVDELSSDGALILAVDDLDLADAESLQMLERLIAGSSVSPIAVLGTIRTGQQRDEVARFIARSQVAILDVPPFDLLDLDALVHEHTGDWPDPAVRSMLAPVAGNALHALAILDGLVASGALRETGRIGAAAASSSPTVDIRNTVATMVATLAGTSLDVARALAVYGAPATIEDIAGVLAVPPLSLLGPVQRLLDAHVVVAVGEAITFANDLYRQAVYDAAPLPVRRLLHSAAGAHGGPAERARHVMASQARPDEVVGAVLAAAHDLDNAPGVTAELVADALASTDVDEEAAAALTATRARALARSGRLREAWEAAHAAQARTQDPAVLTALRRVELFSLTTRGQVDAAQKLISATLVLPLPDRIRAMLAHHRSYLSLLGGRGPVPLEPLAAAADDVPLNGLVAEALRRCLLGDTAVALEYGWLASRRYLAADHDPNEGLSADIWLPFIELFHSGPDAARLALHEVVRRRDERGDGWQTAGHQSIGGGIDALAGNLEDAVAQYDAAAESATRSELGWTSQMVGWRILLDVLRGDSPAAARRLAAWDADPGVVQLGIPQVERARMALLEAERRYAEAADIAQRVWSQAIDLRLYAWAAMTAPEVARIALRAADDDLRLRVASDLRNLPEMTGTPPRIAATLARAMCEGMYADLPRTAAEIAELAADSGDGLLRLTATEEAAVATALTGDRDEARSRARDALALAGAFGASGVAARVSGRMRSAGVRLGSAATRARPSHGWESLTPTERTVVDLIAQGLSGPEIARQLHLSPRTVQTHVSHALAKLQVSNRVQLAAVALSRSTSTTAE